MPNGMSGEMRWAGGAGAAIKTFPTRRVLGHATPRRPSHPLRVDIDSQIWESCCDHQTIYHSEDLYKDQASDQRARWALHSARHELCISVKG